ncbi:sarcosine oxidase subunit gamma family protein [Methylopila sp. 73B]|uniref:sarcosine oxidase subunit gamma n=1 Tax=Methylopila sp. 73B TaxID=1120792 RepID=UPI000373658D|nr:sarcosine oxidase subunit gamma family protein [Methylopila sp. 73B]
MAEPLVARSAFRPHVAPLASPSGAAGVALREAEGLTLASVAAFRGREAELADAVRAAYGIELPAGPKRVASGDVAFVGAGPGKWLAVSSGASDFAGLPAAIADQSDGRTVVRVSGSRARETLATLTAVDLHPRVFGVGDAALTHAASISIHLWQVDDAPTYEIAVFRTFAATFWRWMAEAARSRGVDARHGG